MRWLLAIVGAVLGLSLGEAIGEDGGFVFGALVGFVIGWIIERERLRVAQLQGRAPGRPVDRVEALSARVAELERTVATLSARLDTVAASAPVGDAAPASVPAQPLAEAQPSVPERAPAGELEPVTDQSALPLTAARAVPTPTPAPLRWLAHARTWLLGGNTVVRVGVLVLTVGVGLLVKYAADHAYLPLTLRLSFAAAIGLTLVLLGVRLRGARPGFATALQGGGVGALYLVTFFAYYAYRLLPAALTMGLLVGIAACSTVLAVVQHATQLSVLGAIGGFLAPLLAGQDGGSQVALFSYYALLNVAIAASAWYRAARALNWTGFLFTFGIASAWGALRYEPAQLASSAGFLGLFFLLYLLSGSLYALRQPAARRGDMDTTLTFGTPLATLALAGGLFQHQPLAFALWCAGMSAVYLLAARTLLGRHDGALAVLSLSYVALGVGLATLAIPFALGDELATALSWAAEASGLIWVGVRQRRLRTRLAGLALFAAALGSYLLHAGRAPTQALLSALIALALSFASAAIERAKLGRGERIAGRVLLACGLLIWLDGWQRLLAGTLVGPHYAAARLLAHALDMVALDWLAARLGFRGLSLYPRLGFPLLLALGSSLVHEPGLSQQLAWPLAIAASYAALYRQRPTGWQGDALHACASFVITLFLLDLGYELGERFELSVGFRVALVLAAPLLPALLSIRARPRWPFASHPRGYRWGSALPLLIADVLAACFVQAVSDGDPAPLPFVPLLNPFDLVQLALVLALAHLALLAQGRLRSATFFLAAFTLFLTLNGSIVRTAHFHAGVPFRELELPGAPIVQAAFSILWTVLALIAMLIARRAQLRVVWVGGAALLSVVVAKLFLLDLDGLGSGTKIITFLAVGLLLLLIGWYAPVPPARAEPAT